MKFIYNKCYNNHTIKYIIKFNIYTNFIIQVLLLVYNSFSFNESIVIQVDREGEEDSKPHGILRNEKLGIGNELSDNAKESYSRFASLTHGIL